jgi:hypothetical protein
MRDQIDIAFQEIAARHEVSLVWNDNKIRDGHAGEVSHTCRVGWSLGSDHVTDRAGEAGSDLEPDWLFSAKGLLGRCVTTEDTEKAVAKETSSLSDEP